MMTLDQIDDPPAFSTDRTTGPDETPVLCDPPMDEDGSRFVSSRDAGGAENEQGGGGEKGMDLGKEGISRIEVPGLMPANTNTNTKKTNMNMKMKMHGVMPKLGGMPERGRESQRKGNGNRDHDLGLSRHDDAAASAEPVEDDRDISPSSLRLKTKNKLATSDLEAETIPVNKMMVVMPSICLVLFLAALDQTIIATSLPTIASEFNATPSQYQWVGTAYLLASTCVIPATGRLSDIVGRKKVLFPGILVFIIGSAMCGASTSMNMLIGSRAVQGIGGGLIMTLVQIIVADITTMRSRGAWSSFISATWGIAGSLGPVLGGLITQRASWRWCFYINLPTSVLAGILLGLKLNLNPPKKIGWSQFLRTFDFLGLALIMSGAALLVVGSANAADKGWSDPVTIALMTVGATLFSASILQFLTTRRNAIIPSRMFRTRTTVAVLLSSTLHSSAFVSSFFFLPIFFQGVLGASPVMSGVYLLPYSICLDASGIFAGQTCSRLRITRPLIWAGYSLASLGFGLGIKYFIYGQPVASMMGISVLIGIGVGLSLTIPLIIVQSVMPFAEMGSATTGWLVTRALGTTLSIAVFEAVLSSQLKSRFYGLEGYGTDFVVPTNLDEYHQMYNLPHGSMRDAALTAFSSSFRTIYIVWTSMFAIAFLLSLFVKQYSMNRVAGKPTVDEAENGCVGDGSGPNAASPIVVKSE